VRYEIQEIPGYGGGYRITDTIGDNRVATCWDPHNARLIVSALNAFNGTHDCDNAKPCDAAHPWRCRNQRAMTPCLCLCHRPADV